MLPILTIERLVLRPFHPEDCHTLAELAGVREIADTMISIHHPYRPEDAERRIREANRECSLGTAGTFAVTLAVDGSLVGSVELRSIDAEHRQAELSFWIGVPWWGRGYATEAAERLIAYGFEDAGVNRIYAHHMIRNPSSGRVLDKVGMTREGVLRQRVWKWGKPEDVALCAILRDDWIGRVRSGSP